MHLEMLNYWSIKPLAKKAPTPVGGLRAHQHKWHVVAFLSKQLKCTTSSTKVPGPKIISLRGPRLWVLCPCVHFLHCSKDLGPKKINSTYLSNSLAPQSTCHGGGLRKRITTQISNTNLPQSYILTPSSSWMLTSAPSLTRSFTLSKLPCLAAMCKEFL